MKVTAFLIKYGEIAIKGKNRYMFEDALMKQIRHAMAPVGDFKVRKESGRMFVEAQDDLITTKQLKHYGESSVLLESVQWSLKKIKIWNI